MSNVPLSTCKFCGIGKVPITKANRRCESCRQTLVGNKLNHLEVRLGRRKPAAIVEVSLEETTEKEKLFVDKFGNPVENPGYDLERDPRGWDFAGMSRKPRTLT